LDYTKPHELIVASILSAQCIDDRVNATTPELFSRYPNIEDFASASEQDLQRIIYSCGMSTKKANYIRVSMSQAISWWNGEFPNDIKRLCYLKGVGRKIANLFVMSVYGEQAVVVDTHVDRVAGRLGWSSGPEFVEGYIRTFVPKERWNYLTRQMIKFGREICSAQSPSCNICPLKGKCEA
jgi:endonuclease-3